MHYTFCLNHAVFSIYIYMCHTCVPRLQGHYALCLNGTFITINYQYLPYSISFYILYMTILTMYYIGHTILLYDCNAECLYLSIFTFSLSQLFFTFLVLSQLLMICNIIHNYNTQHVYNLTWKHLLLPRYCFFFFLWITSHFCMFTVNVGFWSCDLSYQQLLSASPRPHTV